MSHVVADYRAFSAQTRHFFDRPHEGVPSSPIDDPSVWRGALLRDREAEWRVMLTAADIDELDTALAAVREARLSLPEITRERFPLPRLGAQIAGWRKRIEAGLGFVVVSALPVDRWTQGEVAAAFWGIGHHLGLPGGQNPDEELLGHVKDYDEEADNPFVRRYRTAGNIDFHCDAADVVGLLCLRTAKRGGQSRIVSSGYLYNECVRRFPELAPRLFEPFRLDGRGEQQPGKPLFSEVPPCRFANGRLKTFYHSEYFRSVERHDGVNLSVDERRILDVYDELAADPENHLDLWLEPGDMQFLSNHTLAHARTAYEDGEDPQLRRHLLRLWLSFD